MEREAESEDEAQCNTLDRARVPMEAGVKRSWSQVELQRWGMFELD